MLLTMCVACVSGVEALVFTGGGVIGVGRASLGQLRRRVRTRSAPRGTGTASEPEAPTEPGLDQP